MPTPDQMLGVVEAYKKAFTTADKDAWLALFTEDCEQFDPYPGPANVGHEGLTAFWDRSFTLGSDFAFDGPEPIVAGDRVCMPFTISLAMGGARYAFDGVDVFEFDEAGKVKRITAYWDPTKVRPL
jgi:steroid delta-isomerase